METLYFGNILKELREKSGMTQKQLALYIGTSKTSISLYEAHQRMPTPDTLASLADVFHVSTDYLLGVDKKKKIDVTGLREEDIAHLEALVRSLRESENDVK